MHLNKNEIHVLVAPLTEMISDERSAVLNHDERERAMRLLSPLHQQRFIASHVILREILGLYLHADPAILQFAYNSYRKPTLAAPFASSLQFNISHSEDLAVYAITRSGDIGIDIEKIGPGYKSDIAERFFTSAEIAALAALPPSQQAVGFYRVWARKEAIIKANGKGLSQELSSFSVAVEDRLETILTEENSWTLIPLAIHPAYAAALASAEPNVSLSIWDMINNKPVPRPARPASS